MKLTRLRGKGHFRVFPQNPLGDAAAAGEEVLPVVDAVEAAFRPIIIGVFPAKKGIRGWERGRRVSNRSSISYRP
jgi:hypothetical protein